MWCTVLCVWVGTVMNKSCPLPSTPLGVPLIGVGLSWTLQEVWDWLRRCLGKKESRGSSTRLKLFKGQWNPIFFFLCSASSLFKNGDNPALTSLSRYKANLNSGSASQTIKTRNVGNGVSQLCLLFPLLQRLAEFCWPVSGQDPCLALSWGTLTKD